MRNMKALMLFSFLPLAALAAQPPASVILDAQRAATAASFPVGGVTVSNVFYTVARTSFPPFSSGEWSLIRTDGTVDGTRVIMTTNGSIPRLAPYQDNSFLPQYQNPSTLAVVNGLVIFRGNGELWRTDGTATGTFLVRSITGTPIPWSVPDEFVTIGSTVFFSAHDGVNGRELWKTDGTSNGTVMVKNINAGAANSDPRSLTAAGSLLYFVANDGAGPRIWVSDGSEAGTISLGNYLPRRYGRLSPMTYVNFDLIYDLEAEGTKVMFYSTNIVSNFRYHVADGLTPASVTVTQLMPTGFVTFNDTYRIYSGGGKFYFSYSFDTWRSDGTSAGTASFDASLDSAFEEVYWHSNALYGTLASTGPGRSDGTLTGSYAVASFNSGDLVAGDHAQDWYSVGSTLYYTARPNSNYWALYRVEGTNSILLRTFPEAVAGSDLRMLGSLGSTLLFAGPGGSTNDIELWKSDGTPEGTKVLLDLNLELQKSYAILGDTVSNRAFFVSYNASSNPAPVRTGGRLADVVMFAAVTSIHDLVRAGDNLFSVGLDPVVSSPTNRITAFPLGGGAPTMIPLTRGFDPFYPYFLSTVGSKALFVLYSSTNAYSVYVTDGTIPGTLQLIDVPLISSLEDPPTAAYPVGSRALFSLNNITNGFELHATDGTVPGTGLVTNLNPGSSSGVSAMNTDRGGAALGSYVYFRGNNGVIGSELWRSDGTVPGTTLVSDVRPGPNSSSPSDFVTHAGFVYFSAIGTNSGRELWKSDGGSTVLVRDINPGAGSSLIDIPASVGSRLVFVATDSTNGVEPWASDGTSNGTYMIKDVRPGPGDGDPEGGWSAGGWYFFTADDGVHGRELWATDGTSSNTFMVEDASPGQHSTQMDQAESAGNFLLCQMTRRVEGTLVREVRAIWPDNTTGGFTNPIVRIISAHVVTSGTTLVEAPYSAVMLSTTNAITNFVLEASTDLLDPASWRTVLTQPSYAGAQWSTTNYTLENVRSYRLRRY